MSSYCIEWDYQLCNFRNVHSLSLSLLCFYYWTIGFHFPFKFSAQLTAWGNHGREANDPLRNRTTAELLKSWMTFCLLPRIFHPPKPLSMIVFWKIIPTLLGLSEKDLLSSPTLSRLWAATQIGPGPEVECKRCPSSYGSSTSRVCANSPLCLCNHKHPHSITPPGLHLFNFCNHFSNHYNWAQKILTSVPVNQWITLNG